MSFTDERDILTCRKPRSRISWSASGAHADLKRSASKGINMKKWFAVLLCTLSLSSVSLGADDSEVHAQRKQAQELTAGWLGSTTHPWTIALGQNSRHSD